MTVHRRRLCSDVVDILRPLNLESSSSDIRQHVLQFHLRHGGPKDFLLRQRQDAIISPRAATIMTDGLSYKMPLEVYLQAAIVRGVLETNQDRLSSHLLLRQGEEVFLLKAASLQHPDSVALSAGSQEYLIYMQEICLIADLSAQSERSGFESLFVKKQASRVLMSVGPYSLQGSIHITPGRGLHDLLIARTPFVPITDASILDGAQTTNRTYLVNRTKIGFITSLGDALLEL